MKPSTISRLIGLGLLVALSASAAHKKFIELGWDIPDTAFLRQFADEMEREGPFDGVIFQVTAKTDNGRTISTQSGWDPMPWKKEWFHPAVADLRAARFTNYTDNFLRFNATPKRIDWADDSGWRALAEKIGICAWLVREGGAKGLALDFEPYGENQWRFDPAAGRTFAETAALARQRGAQFTRSLAAEMPHAVVLALFLNSVVWRAGQADEPETILATASYGLLPAFFNGMLDAAPPAMVLVDGCENGYYFDSVEAYQRAALQMRSWTGPCLQLVAPENRAKYRQQVQAGFGFYLDMFVNEPGHRYYRPPLDGSRLKRLVRNLGAARDAADEYVWIYGEQSRWWSGLAKDKPWRAEALAKTVGKGRAWEEALPGITRAIAWTRDPETASRIELAKYQAQKTVTNLAINGVVSYGPDPGGTLPQGWGAWQDEQTPTGTFAWDDQVGKGSARARKVMRGCFLQSIPVAPGQIYVVKAKCRTQGNFLPNLMVRWQTSERQWTHETDDRTFPFQPDQGAWHASAGTVTVPPDTGRLVVLLNVHGQRTDDDVCWFDELEIYRLPDLPF
ncbi:MAG: hypothetical protein KA236_06680 [Verrucomicrobia bacterium]|nr:hypothetical protein [Verrucomicrobiota bacterium]